MNQNLSTHLIRLAYLTVVVSIVWSSIPEHRRQLLRLAALRRAQVVSWRVARVMGHQAMGSELAGYGQNYDIPYALARLAQDAGTAYDKTRGIY